MDKKKRNGNKNILRNRLRQRGYGIDDDSDIETEIIDIRQKNKIKQGLNKITTIMTPDESITAFNACNSYDELVRLMVGVIEQKVPSPIYRFEPIEEENTDNDWWGPSKTDMPGRWELLRDLNAIGIITFNAQECSETNNFDEEEILPYYIENKISFVNCRTCLDFMCQNELAEQLIYLMEKAGFIVINGIYDLYDKLDNLNENDYVRLPTALAMHNTVGTEEVMSGIRIYKIPTLHNKKVTFSMFIDIVDHLNSNLVQEILNTCTFLTIIDPAFNRPAHHKKGLFTTLLNTFLKGPCQGPEESCMKEPTSAKLQALADLNKILKTPIN